MQTVWIGARALVFMSGFVSVWMWIALSLRKLDAGLGGALPGWVEAPGMGCMIAGAVLALVCAGTFVVRGRGTPAPFDAPRRFVAGGPYRIVRNPMYVGGFLVLAGFGLYLRSPSILLLAAGWLLPAHLFVVWYEEPVLQERFQQAYQEYCRRVPRWIPRILRGPPGRPAGLPEHVPRPSR